MTAYTTDCQTNVMQYLILEPMTDYGGWGGNILINKLPVTLKWRQLFTSQLYISTEGCTSTTSHNRHPLSDKFSQPWFSKHHTMHWLQLSFSIKGLTGEE